VRDAEATAKINKDMLSTLLAEAKDISKKEK
jgi:hypothetical protein